MESLASLDYCVVVDGECRNSLIDYELKSKNTSDLIRIQEVMNMMEGKINTLNEVLERVIRF